MVAGEMLDDFVVTKINSTDSRVWKWIPSCSLYNPWNYSFPKQAASLCLCRQDKFRMFSALGVAQNGDQLAQSGVAKMPVMGYF